MRSLLVLVGVLLVWLPPRAPAAEGDVLLREEFTSLEAWRPLELPEGRHEYLFVVDGQWLPDPNAKESVANPYGGRNSVLTVSE